MPLGQCQEAAFSGADPRPDDTLSTQVTTHHHPWKAEGRLQPFSLFSPYLRFLAHYSLLRTIFPSFLRALTCFLFSSFSFHVPIISPCPNDISSLLPPLFLPLILVSQY